MNAAAALPVATKERTSAPSLMICLVFILWTFCALNLSVIGEVNGADIHQQQPSSSSSRTSNNNNNNNNRQRKLSPHVSLRKPNIVLILTDDQDVELGSLNFMPKTLRAIRDQGADFRHAYVTTPMCCPSRSSLLTGMYVHNHNVYTNNDNCSSTQWQSTHERKSFATYLNNAGYRTGYFGKYLNKYNGSYVPPGWREWGGLIMNSKYYNYSINMNGKKIKHGFDYHKDYYPDLIANDSIAFLRQSKKNSAHKPVMLTMSFPAPHGPEDSAPQYSHLFFNVSTHHTPSYDYAPNPDKQWILQVTNKMQPIHKKFTDLLMTKRLQTLQSVDAAVQLVVDELDRLGELDNTYIIYTSDHGYHLGQFGLIKGKSFPFEFDVRVPFLVRGPGVEPGTVVQDIVLNIDLAPTFLDIAGVDAPPHMDGRSVLPLFLNSKRKRPRWPDTFLIESSGRRETPYLDARLKANRLAAVANRKNNFTTESPIAATTAGITSTTSTTTSTTTRTTTTTTTSKLYESGEEFDSGVDDDDDVGIDDENETDDEEDDEEGDNEFDAEEGGVDEFNFNDESNSTNKNLIKDNELLVDITSRQLPVAVNKLQRLEIECLKSDMDQPCRLHQKWYCVNDNGRWRRHKCKHSTITAAVLPNKAYKKCACFTKHGLIYKKIPLPNVTRRHAAPDRDLQRILFNGEGLENRQRMSRRHKRDTLAHVESAMRDVQGKIYGLKNNAANGTLLEDRTNLATNVISESGADCVVMPRGQVNCSTNIYQDRKTWRESRHRIDNQIYQLKQKLEQLKEIRRHLKHTRPNTELLDIDYQKNNNKTELREINELSEAELIDLQDNENVYENTTKTNRRRRKRPQRNDGKKTTTTTTTSPTIASVPSNPHRHHKYLTTTPTTISSSDISTESSSTTRKRLVVTTEGPSLDDLIPYPNTDICHCDTEDEERTLAKDAKRRLKDEKQKRKLRKQRKRDQQEKACSSERMNCFYHDKEHWKTAPMWTEDDFCFCMNANNNTYSCVRTINATHNFLYCEFTTGLETFYNLRMDPYELQNRIDQLKSDEKNFLHNQLRDLIACKGRSCTVGDSHHHHHIHQATMKPRDNLLPFHSISSRYRKRKPIPEGLLGGRGEEETILRMSPPGARISFRSRNITAKMDILREAGSRRKRRKL